MAEQLFTVRAMSIPDGIITITTIDLTHGVLQYAIIPIQVTGVSELVIQAGAGLLAELIDLAGGVLEDIVMSTLT